jgi:hypothetical protein
LKLSGTILEAMVRIATDPEASLELRGRMNAELAQYVYPQRKAVEVAGHQANPHVQDQDCDNGPANWD